MNILALDLGTKCGWATQEGSGTCDLRPGRFDSAGQRFVKFRVFLEQTHRLYGMTKVVYEEVRNHRAVDAAHVYGGLMAIMQEFCLVKAIEYEGIGVTTIKKYATGNHLADKKTMIAAAIKKFPKINITDDNHADALWILDYALTHSIE